MLIRRETFLKIGSFDDDYFMLYEDVDLGWRMRLYGMPIYMVPDARIMHKGHASLKGWTYNRKAIYYERNSLATLYKNLAEDSLSVILPLALQEALLRAKAIGGIGLPFRYDSAGNAILIAIEKFMHNLPRWKQKRTDIQSHRTVSDSEIFERFFPHPDQRWAYAEEHYKRMAHPAVNDDIEAIYQAACDSLNR